LITALAQVDGLTVIARDSVMRYRGTAKTSKEIATELDVDAVVRGSVIQSRDTVQIRAQLVDPRTGRLLWAETYVRTSRDVMTLLGEIAATVTGELNVHLTPELRTRLTRAQPVVPAANAAYLRGRHHWSKITAEGYWKSLDYFQEAIQLDGHYAPAYAGLARSYMALSQLQRPGDVVPKAREALDKALALDPSLAEAHTLRAQLKMRDLDWRDAEALFQQALALSPNDPLAHLHYAAFLNQSGRHEEALGSVRRAEEIDPLSPLISANVMLRLNSLGRYEETLKQAARARELLPDFWLTEQWAAGATWNLGRRQEAISAWEKALTLPGAYQAWLLSRLTEAYFDVGRRRDAERALSRLVDLAESQYVEPVVLARAYAAVGNRSKAMDVLEEGFRNRELDLWRLKGLERYLGENPRYRELRRAVGGPERSSDR
jgi:tetratricopeptide (TPR) repeat protein